MANKFQTGFDQPLLHTMYVDKKLGGVAAVQTLSRLNRTFPPLKQDTMVLDFVNEQETIQASFQDYYQRTELEGATDPNKLYNIKYTLEKMGVFTPEAVTEFVELFLVKKVKSEKLQPFFQRLVINGYENLAAEHKGTMDDDGYRGGEAEKEKIKLIIQKLNKDYGISFEEADRVVGAIKEKLEKDETLRAAFKTNSIEFLRRQKLQDSIKEAFLSNADEFLNFMSKTETDTGFGNFFFSEMFNWYDQKVTGKHPWGAEGFHLVDPLPYLAKVDTVSFQPLPESG